MKIRKAKKSDWIDIAKCTCGWSGESDDSSKLLTIHHKTKCPDKNTIGQFGNSKAGKKIRKELKTLVGANGEIWIITKTT